LTHGFHLKQHQRYLTQRGTIIVEAN